MVGKRAPGALEPRKRGALSNDDMEFIRKHVDDMEVGEMAVALTRSVIPIRRYIKRFKLGKKYAQAREMGSKTQHIIQDELQKKPFYKALRQQLSVEELDYFNDQWVAMLEQFNGDIFPSEELELKEFLLLEILKNRTLIDKRKWLTEREALKKELEQYNKLPKQKRDDSHLKFLRSEIGLASSQANDCVKAFKDLSDKADKVRHSLKATREQRLKRIESTKLNFNEWLKELTNPEIRAIIAKEMELMRIAMEQERTRLGQFYTYPNKDVDLPILNSETIKNVKTS